jgi:crotonobetainyl-CoA:carnitine CoA-transferase CaiB-like acyl-CoA transferase
MSRCYRIAVSESLKQHITVDDGLETSLELLDILPPDQMLALLGQQLAQRGYVEAEPGKMSRDLGEGVEVEVDLAEGTVHIGVRAGKDIDITVQRTANVANPTHSQQSLKDAARRELELEAVAATAALRVEATRRLEDALSGIRAELDAAVTKATAEALKIKAGQLGEVQEVHEDPVTGSVTIRVRV